MRRAGLGLVAGAVLGVCAGPLAADTILSLSTSRVTLEITSPGIVDMEISESGGGTDMFLRLRPGVAAALADMTADAIGEVMAVRVCNTILVAPVVQDRIDGGSLYLAGTTMVRAEAIRALWQGRESCGTLAPEVFADGK